MPIGPVGMPTEQQNMLNHLRLQLHEISRTRCSEYLRFMWEKAQVDAWEIASNGYVVAAAAGLERQSGLDRRPQGHAVPRRA